MHQSEKLPKEAFKDGDDYPPPPLRAPAVSASTNLNAESLKLAAASPRVRDDMSKTVLEMVEDMRLNEQEVVALRRAISCGDANVDGAMMVFK